MSKGIACEEGNHEFETVIKEFLADSTRRSLELPHMTTGQRKQVKKAAAQHPDLKCESYGFGAERKLHIFKNSLDNKQEDEQPTQKEGTNVVNVKNTFIDDWVRSEAQSEPIIFRSMPDGMYRNLLQHEVRDGPAVAPELLPVEESNSLHAPATQAATVADSPRMYGELELRTAASSSTVVPHVEVFARHENFQVRNTFIHIEEETMDDRIVQSMPRGMFSQIISQVSPGEVTATEKSEEATVVQASTPVLLSWHAPACLADAAEGSQLESGTLVVVEGLLKLPEFNGLSGIIQSFDTETGRYSVLLASPTFPNGQRLAKVKGENLQPCRLPPPPPRHQAPSVFVDAPSTDSLNVPQTPEGPPPLQLAALVPCF